MHEPSVHWAPHPRAPAACSACLTAGTISAGSASSWPRSCTSARRAPEAAAAWAAALRTCAVVTRWLRYCAGMQAAATSGFEQPAELTEMCMNGHLACMTHRRIGCVENHDHILRCQMSPYGRKDNAGGSSCILDGHNVLLCCADEAGHKPHGANEACAGTPEHATAQRHAPPTWPLPLRAPPCPVRPLNAAAPCTAVTSMNRTGCASSCCWYQTCASSATLRPFAAVCGCLHSQAARGRAIALCTP